jgi:hypothetical protein
MSTHAINSSAICPVITRDLTKKKRTNLEVDTAQIVQAMPSAATWEKVNKHLEDVTVHLKEYPENPLCRGAEEVHQLVRQRLAVAESKGEEDSSKQKEPEMKKACLSPHISGKTADSLAKTLSSSFEWENLLQDDDMQRFFDS